MIFSNFIIHSRTKFLLKNISGPLLSKIVNLASTLVLVPLALNGLGSNDYGIFAAILAAMIFFSYSDLGLGLVIVNKVAYSKCKETLLEAKIAISSVWFFLIYISLTIMFLGTLTSFFLSVLNIATYSKAISFGLTLSSCFSLGLAPSLTQRILFGMQKNLEANLWNSLSKLFSLFGVYLAYSFHASIEYYLLSVIGLPALIAWVSTISIWLRFPDFKPEKKYYSRDKLGTYIPEGFRYLFLQLGVFFEAGIDNILIIFVLGSTFVTKFDLLAKLFLYIPALMSLIIFPLWPAIAQAKAHGDLLWIKKILVISYLFVGFASIVLASLLVFSHSKILHLWTGVDYMPNYSLAFAVGIFSILTSLGSLQSIVFNSLNLLNLQVRALAIFLILLIPSKLFALFFYGPVAMVWSLNFLYIIKLVSLVFLNKLFSKNKSL